MSLQVWLPLNGDLENKGLSNLTFRTISPTAVVDSGRATSKCYRNGGNFTTGGIISDSSIDLGTKQSMCCWVKFDAFNSGAELTGIGGQHRYATPTGMGLNARYKTSTTGYLAVSTANSSGRTYKDYYGSTVLTAGTWYHVCYTYDGSTIKLYVDGKLDKTVSYSGQIVVKDKILLFGWSLDDTKTNDIHNNYQLKGYLQDFRVYDQCLSPREVHEISKGLALHYKLDHLEGINGNPNLLLDTYSLRTVATTGNKLTINSGTLTNYDGFGVRGVSNPSTTTYVDWLRWAVTSPKLGQIYTLSFYAKGKVINSATYGWGSCIYFYGDSGYLQVAKVESSWGVTGTGADGNTVINTSNSPLKENEWTKCWIRWTLKDSGSTTVNKYVLFRTAKDNSLFVYGVKLEEGPTATPWCPATSDIEYKTTAAFNSTTIEDHSGHGNDGKATNILLASDSAKYDNCVNLVSGSYITVPNLLNRDSTVTELTTSIWWKTNTLNSTTPNLISLGGNGFLRLRLQNSTSIWYYARIGSTSSGTSQAVPSSITSSLIDNRWHQCVFTFSKGVCTIYIDGTLIKSIDRVSDGVVLTCDNTNWLLGGYQATSEQFIGSLSDFRIYNKALTDDEVKDLYNTRASITDGGSMLSGEFKEKSLDTDFIDYMDTTHIYSTGWNPSIYKIDNETIRLVARNGWCSFAWQDYGWDGENVILEFDYLITDSSELSSLGVFIFSAPSNAYNDGYKKQTLTVSTTWQHCSLSIASAQKAIGFNVRISDGSGNSGSIDIRNLRIYIPGTTSVKINNNYSVQCEDFIEYHTPKNEYLYTNTSCSVLQSDTFSTTYTPGTGTNSCGCTIGCWRISKPGVYWLEYDISFSGFTGVNSTGSFSMWTQGTSRNAATEVFEWAGVNAFSNTGTTGLKYGTKTSSFTAWAKAGGSYHVAFAVEFTQSMLNSVNGGAFQIRSDYSDGKGKVTISNPKIYEDKYKNRQGITKFYKNSDITSVEFIEI